MRLYLWVVPQRHRSISSLEEILYGRTYVVSVEVVDVGLREHGVVLQLTLTERWGVASYN